MEQRRFFIGGFWLWGKECSQGENQAVGSGLNDWFVVVLEQNMLTVRRSDSISYYVNTRNVECVEEVL